MRHVRFARIAAVAFLAVATYTIPLKAARGELAGDWLHSALHVVTGLVAAGLGWSVRLAPLAPLLTAGVLAGYGVLAVVGWLVDGFFLGTPLAIPLGPADNVFHAALAAVALAAWAGASPRRRARSAREGRRA